MGAKDSYTIDELAQAAGMTPRNVRAYRTKGLLSPPSRVGRTSRYRVAHLHRLRDIRRLREAGLPLKLIIEAANRGEDLGPTGMLWLAAGRARAAEAAGAATGAGADSGGIAGPEQTLSFVVDPEAYAIMQALTDRGLTPSTVLLMALRTARASSALAADLRDLLTQGGEDAQSAHDLPTPAKTSVIDLATVITREMLGHSLAITLQE